MQDLLIEGHEVLLQVRVCRVAQVDHEGFKFVADPKSAITAFRELNARIFLLILSGIAGDLSAILISF